MKSQKRQSSSSSSIKQAKALKTTHRKLHTKRKAPRTKSHQLSLQSQSQSLLSPSSLFQFNLTTFTPLSFKPSQSFHTTTPLLPWVVVVSKSEPTKKRFDTPEKAPKKDLTQADKDKKKLEKLEREKAKQATRAAQLNRSTERAKKETELHAKKQANLQSLFAAAHLKIVEVDEKERAELEANAKRNELEDEEAKAARALRRSSGTADV